MLKEIRRYLKKNGFLDLGMIAKWEKDKQFKKIIHAFERLAGDYTDVPEFCYSGDFEEYNISFVVTDLKWKVILRYLIGQGSVSQLVDPSSIFAKELGIKFDEDKAIKITSKQLPGKEKSR